MKIVESLGNLALLDIEKHAFFCSRRIAAGAVLRCYDWAVAQREAGKCVLSGFHSTIEQEVLYYLLKGKQPIIVALARGLKQKIEKPLQKALEEERLLIITPFAKSVMRTSTQNAQKRNELMLSLADTITVGYASQGGSLETLLQNTDKEIHYLF